MTFPTDDEHGEFLRRAMRAEADSVVPSPEGLDIIRRRIDERGARGLRGLFWWRVGASVAGAALVASTVVMLIPDLRTQVMHSTVSNTGDDSRLTDTSSVQRPQNHIPAPAVTNPPPRGQVSSVETPRASNPPAKPSPSPSDPCATPAMPDKVIEPDAAGSPMCPTAETPTPSASPSVGPTPTRTPSGCSGRQCETPTPKPSPTPTPTPSASDVVTPEAVTESPAP
ncbi:hypothetical protein [Microtetraspora sp. NBRC 16547]|uniref:hypothetical protein n=1 Tax=Microtetraspora sp. NBRC 16547 TaxID=3030993 RepID=UPI0024A52123|nr:hypothetical protein [Microtetraspora sp. NBRC 16547]GLW97906.1 hypothetical protein Misp02_19930 [Microtetraspora sp. NBRC 16547]